MASRTALPSSASSPSEHTAVEPELLRLMGELIDRDGRREAARTLARHLEADDLLMFVRDQEVSVLLPALGFPQTLPRPRLMRALVEDCVRSGMQRGQVAYPDEATLTPALAHPGADGSVLVLLGGEPRVESIRAACLCLPLVASALRIERHGQLAQSHALAAQEAAEKARMLAARLDATRLELQRALQLTELGRRRAAFLAEAAALMATSLDSDATLASIGSMVVPLLADWCIVDLPIPHGGFRRGPVTTINPSQEALARKLEGVYELPAEGSSGVWNAIRSGRSELCTDLTELALLGIAGRSERLPEIKQIGIRSYMCIPLIARGRTLGTLLFISAGSGRIFRENDLVLATDLAGRIALTVDNLQLYHNAQEALKIRDDFISIAAHELRTPVTPLQLTLDSLQREVKNSPDEGKVPVYLVRKHLDIAVRQTDRLIKLVNNVLDVSRLSAGRLDLQLEEVDLSLVVEEVVARFAEDATQAGCTLVVQTHGPVIGRWDRLRLDQVVTNFLSNGLKYGRGSPIELQVQATLTSARLSVRDYGIGISPEDQERIFDRFERAVSEHYFAGFGLGLWIVSEIAKALRGRVQVTSTPGAGSVFSMELPRSGPHDT
jgi:signal transduction histidine kinase